MNNLKGKTLDVISMGRAGVDLYGQQVGGRLEDMGSFAKYVGGCPANIAVGTARMGLKSALLSRVGNEHMGRFIRQTLEDEGVDTSFLKTDPKRLTALVILGIQDRETFPLIFYRENCADMALEVGDFSEEFIASSKALVITGTHLSTDSTKTATMAAVAYAKAHGTKVVLDIDYRPVLWGLTDPGLGEERFVSSKRVTDVISDILGHCDLIVGTEEELHIAGGSTDTIEALKGVRAQSNATIALKLGAQGCTIIERDVPASIDDATVYDGFPVEVFNVLGAGDAFMSGLLKGYIDGLSWEETCKYANACGAIVVSRHGCAPAIPSLEEVEHFIENGSKHFGLRHDKALEQLHWSTTRAREFPEVLAFAYDHRMQLEDVAEQNGKSADDIGKFKLLCWRGFEQVRARYSDRGFGILCDGRLGVDALDKASDRSIWIGRPIELPGSRPLRFEGGESLAATLAEWPQEHCVKCLVFYHPDDTEEMRQEQEQQVLRLAAACHATGHELLLEIIPPKSSAREDTTVVRAIKRFYHLGVCPDWWKLPAPLSANEWQLLSDEIEKSDPHCRGIVLLGLDAPEADVHRSIRAAAAYPVCKGFAVGRTIFGDAARGWFAGSMTDEAVIEQIAERYERLVQSWIQARDENERAIA